MSFKKIIELQAESTVSLKEPGESFTGFYLGYKTTTTSFGESRLHIFSTEEGTVGVWGKTQMDRKLTPAPAGQKGLKLGMLVQVTLLANSVMKNGRRTATSFDVQYDDAVEPMDMSNIAVTVSSGPSESEHYAGDSSEAADVDPDEVEEDEEEYTPPPVQAAPPKKTAIPSVVTAEQKAKAAATLNKYRGGAKA